MGETDNRAARPLACLGAIAMFLAVALGAFGAHGLRAVLPADRLATYQTAVTYHQLHGLALLALAALSGRLGSTRLITWSGWLLVAGVVLFSGSLYALALSGTRWLGVITPLGGVCFLAGWAVAAVAALRRSA